MRKGKRRGKGLLALLLAGTLCCQPTGMPPDVQWAGKAQAAGDVFQTRKQDFRILSGDEMMKDMGAGWNLGNTMDGHTGFSPGETIWQHVVTTKKLIKSVHDMGFHTVRIPVTWGTMIDDAHDYAINEKWIGRVQDIVDYCVSLDMYAIINIHHDGAEQTGWLRIASSDQEGLKKKFAGVWRNIANVFKDYDEHLIFESMNEVKGESMTVVQENQVIMALNQIFVDTVRGTGSNNEKRWLMVPGKYNYIDSICNEKNQFSLPKDTAENRLMVSVHIYTPNNFCMGEYNNNKVYSVEKLDANDREVKPLYDTYSSKGIPVVVGEYGCINKNNPTERAFYLEGMNRIFKKYQCVGVYWDQGWYDRTQDPDYSFTIIDRESGKPVEKEVTDGLLRGYGIANGETDYATLQKSPEIKAITSLAASEGSVEIGSGEWKTLGVSFAPADSNDVILWKSADETIATVSEGNIHGKRPGNTKITVFTQNGTASQDIDVTVKNAASGKPCTDIGVAEETLDMSVGESEMLALTLAPADTEDAMYFSSSNEEVATVSPLGKVVAMGNGEAKITVIASSGVSREVTVQVTGGTAVPEIRLAVNVYYNDNDKKYYANEVSSQVATMKMNGQYTLDFDCDRDLSQKAKDAGVSELANLTAIYIKDYDVTQGNASRSPLQKCNIRYDSVKVNGVSLKVTKTEKKSAMKDSGIFDTNDPVNSWDGSAIEGVKGASGVANFTDVKNPKKISITFTLSDMLFEGQTQSPGTLPGGNTSTNPGGSTGDKKPQDENPDNKKDEPGQGKKGTSFQVKAIKYQIRKVAGKKPGEVSCVTLASKKASSASVPASVSFKGKKYNVTAIGNQAFAGATKLRKATIGANVEKIGRKAFYGSKKLKQITIKTKKLASKKVGAKAFSGIGKKVVIKVPKPRKKAYKKILAKKGMPKKAKVK